MRRMEGRCARAAAPGGMLAPACLLALVLAAFGCGGGGGATTDLGGDEAVSDPGVDASGEDVSAGEDVAGREDVTVPDDGAILDDHAVVEDFGSDEDGPLVPDEGADAEPDAVADADAPQDPGPDDPGPDDPGPSDPGAEPGDPGIPDPGAEADAEDPGPLDPGLEASDPGPDAANPCAAAIPGRFQDPAWTNGPVPNAYAWDSSWVPAAFPIPGLYDDEYGDGHLVGGNATPILPPGRWDWNDADDDLANWRNFATNLGEFWRLKDGCDRHFGWRFVAKNPGAIDFAAAAEYFQGSAGADLLLLGQDGAIHSITGGTGGGPDVLVFGVAYSLEYRTGATADVNAANDDDLVVAGCTPDAGTGYPVYSMTVHTGPGRDWLFGRNIRSAALDAGNGDGGRTDVLDPLDGDDFGVIGGNIKDLRFFGGLGDDVLTWYLQEMNESTPYMGGDFFGGGGSGDAIWGDPGTDRLVLVVPPDTPVVDVPQELDQGGFVLVMRENASSCLTDPGTTCDPVWDPQSAVDPYAKYCVTCGKGPLGQRTLFVQWVSPDRSINTGYVSVTAFEELQLGSGPDAKVYRLDQIAGKATLAPDLVPFLPPAYPYAWCAMP